MHLQINLSPQIEAQLNERAAQTGKAPEALALEAIEEKLAYEVETVHRKKLSHAEFRAKLDALTALFPKTTHFVDDSRDSIYEGRGE